MNKKDLKRLGRRDLLEMLLELSKENEQLRERNKCLEAQLQDRVLTIAEAGSMAEASLKLNNVFKAAQEACEQYIFNTQLRCKKMEEDAKRECAQMLNEASCLMEIYEKEDLE